MKRCDLCRKEVEDIVALPNIDSEKTKYEKEIFNFCRDCDSKLQFFAEKLAVIWYGNSTIIGLLKKYDRGNYVEIHKKDLEKFWRKDDKKIN